MFTTPYLFSISFTSLQPISSSLNSPSLTLSPHLHRFIHFIHLTFPAAVLSVYSQFFVNYAAFSCFEGEVETVVVVYEKTFGKHWSLILCLWKGGGVWGEQEFCFWCCLRVMCKGMMCGMMGEFVGLWCCDILMWNEVFSGFIVYVW